MVAWIISANMFLKIMMLSMWAWASITRSNPFLLGWPPIIYYAKAHQLCQKWPFGLLNFLNLKSLTNKFCFILHSQLLCWITKADKRTFLPKCTVSSCKRWHNCVLLHLCLRVFLYGIEAKNLIMCLEAFYLGRDGINNDIPIPWFRLPLMEL